MFVMMIVSQRAVILMERIVSELLVVHSNCSIILIVIPSALWSHVTGTKAVEAIVQLAAGQGCCMTKSVKSNAILRREPGITTSAMIQLSSIQLNYMLSEVLNRIVSREPELVLIHIEV